MKTVIFDVMCNGRFVMQYRHTWCPAFPIDLKEVVNEIVAKRPTLKGKCIELFETKSILK
jgi:hypothetical protein|nr:MAG TPA: hypothetical protein [Herelleviridae sp.]